MQSHFNHSSVVGMLDDDDDDDDDLKINSMRHISLKHISYCSPKTMREIRTNNCLK